MLSKISVLLLIASITPVQLHVRLTHGCGILTVVWGMASIFVTAFACRLPQPWDFVNGQCINKVRCQPVDSFRIQGPLNADNHNVERVLAVIRSLQHRHRGCSRSHPYHGDRGSFHELETPIGHHMLFWRTSVVSPDLDFHLSSVGVADVLCIDVQCDWRNSSPDLLPE